MMIGGESLSNYFPESGIIEKQDCKEKPSNQIWKLKYTSNGSTLYAAYDGGKVKRFRRYPDGGHKFIGDLFSHKSDVYDMDISPYDEYIVTASKDKKVGILCLGPPNHGWTGYCELT